MSLSFLSTKSFHPQNFRNREKVWQKEQEALAEMKKMDEIKKEYEQEREREAMDEIAIQAGLKKDRNKKLDWMYEGPQVAKAAPGTGGASSSSFAVEEEDDVEGNSHNNSKKKEQKSSGVFNINDILQGKVFKQKDNQDELAMPPVTAGTSSDNVESSNSNPTAQLIPKGLTQKELDMKMTEDPVYAVKKKQQEMIETIKSNPVALKKIKERLENQKANASSHSEDDNYDTRVKHKRDHDDDKSKVERRRRDRSRSLSSSSSSRNRKHRRRRDRSRSRDERRRRDDIDDKRRRTHRHRSRSRSNERRYTRRINAHSSSSATVTTKPKESNINIQQSIPAKEISSSVPDTITTSYTINKSLGPSEDIIKARKQMLEMYEKEKKKI